MKRIIVTGAGGFVGGYVAKQLSQKGHKVFGILHTANEEPYDFETIVCDFSKSFDLEMDVDVVIHIGAANTPPEGQIFSYSKYVESNIIGTKHVVEYAEKHSTFIIYLSSTATYGEVEGGVLHGDYNKHKGMDYYALTKYAGELFIDEIDSIKKLIIKVPAVLGLQSTMGPWIVKCREQLFKNQIVKIYNPYCPTNNMVYISDLVQFINKVILEDKIINEKVILGAYDFITIQEVVNFMKKEMNSNSNIYIEDKTVTSVKSNYYIDTTKARALGYESMPCRESLSIFCREYIECKNK